MIWFVPWCYSTCRAALVNDVMSGTEPVIFSTACNNHLSYLTKDPSHLVSSRKLYVIYKQVICMMSAVQKMR